MINKLTATGFRSLSDFELEIRPGLNVLVGPNGGGKTNILGLISFLSALASNELGDAINYSGGASKVFQKLKEGEFQRHISISVYGHYPINRKSFLPPVYENKLLDAGLIGIRYSWEIEIDATNGFDGTFYKKQNLRVTALTKSLIEPREDEWHLELEILSSDGDSFEVREERHNEEICALLERDTLGAQKSESTSSSLIARSDRHDLSATAIFFLMEKVPIARWIGRDLRSGTTFNFDPSVCKLPNDSAKSPVLSPNGDGLAATLYAIWKASIENRASAYFYSPRDRFSKHIYKKLIDYFQLINYSVTGFRAVNDSFSNKITVYVDVPGDKNDVDFPLEFISDGTVKWLAFLTALLTESSGFALEEPENFLHPDIQRQAVELIRAETEESDNLYVLLTTHSETLLNSSKPDEIILVSMTDGITASKRLDDPDAIDNEIFETGFGLGYFYISGALNE